jgi:hypothetical protein
MNSVPPPGRTLKQQNQSKATKENKQIQETNLEVDIKIGFEKPSEGSPDYRIETDQHLTSLEVVSQDQKIEKESVSDEIYFESSSPIENGTQNDKVQSEPAFVQENIQVGLIESNKITNVGISEENMVIQFHVQEPGQQLLNVSDTNLVSQDQNQQFDIHSEVKTLDLSLHQTDTHNSSTGAQNLEQSVIGNELVFEGQKVQIEEINVAVVSETTEELIIINEPYTEEQKVQVEKINVAIVSETAEKAVIVTEPVIDEQKVQVEEINVAVVSETTKELVIVTEPVIEEQKNSS